MRKLDGLRFLQENFPRLTVDCLFVDKQENLNEEALQSKDDLEHLWRVRCGSRAGSELKLPQGTFTKIKELRQFMKEQKARNSNMEFVIHRVSPEYFSAPFVGTLAVYNSDDIPRIRIELQKVTQELVDAIDTGKRPRDWEACLILDYDFLSKSPKVRKKQDVNLEALKYPIAVIHEVGEQIFDLYDKKGEHTDTYTRFNIYDLGQVLFDDHRSIDSFVPKCKTPLVPKNFSRQGKMPSIDEKEMEL